VNRLDFQNLAHEKIAEAKILLDAGKWTGAYYLAGYAVECGLKACIANLLKSEIFPEKSFSDKLYIHDLKKLIVLAGLELQWDADRQANNNLFTH
jgi:HEPN domain-containing protein